MRNRPGITWVLTAGTRGAPGVAPMYYPVKSERPRKEKSPSSRKIGSCNPRKNRTGL